MQHTAHPQAEELNTWAPAGREFSLGHVPHSLKCHALRTVVCWSCHAGPHFPNFCQSGAHRQEGPTQNFWPSRSGVEGDRSHPDKSRVTRGCRFEHSLLCDHPQFHSLQRPFRPPSCWWSPSLQATGTRGSRLAENKGQAGLTTERLEEDLGVESTRTATWFPGVHDGIAGGLFRKKRNILIYSSPFIRLVQGSGPHWASYVFHRWNIVALRSLMGALQQAEQRPESYLWHLPRHGLA